MKLPLCDQQAHNNTTCDDINANKLKPDKCDSVSQNSTNYINELKQRRSVCYEKQNIYYVIMATNF